MDEPWRYVNCARVLINVKVIQGNILITLGKSCCGKVIILKYSKYSVSVSYMSRK